MNQEYFYINNKMTPRLEQLIQSMDTLEQFEARYPAEFLNDDDHIGNYLSHLLAKYDMGTDSELSVRANLSHSYVGHIVNGRKKNPSRDALISICLTIGSTVDEVQYLLKYAGQAPLYVRRKRDVVIWFGFMKKMSLDEVNENLIVRGYKSLSKNA